LRLPRRARGRRARRAADLLGARGGDRPLAPRARDAPWTAGRRARGRRDHRGSDPRCRLRGRSCRVTAEAASPAAHARTAEWTERLRSLGILIPFAVLFAVLSLTSASFFTKPNLLNILDQQSATLIIAAAGTLVLIAGGIDLSVGAVYGFAGVTSAHF